MSLIPTILIDATTSVKLNSIPTTSDWRSTASTRLFDGTVQENIALTLPDARGNCRSSQNADAHNFMTLPQATTPEWGAGFCPSLVDKQRVAIARCSSKSTLAGVR